MSIVFSKARISTLRTLLHTKQALSTGEIARHTRTAQETVASHVAIFEKQGWIEEEDGKPARSGLVRRFQLTHEGRIYVTALLREQDS